MVSVFGFSPTLINPIRSLIPWELWGLLTPWSSVDILTHGYLSWLMANSMSFSMKLFPVQDIDI